jgi:hypothetical protein
MLNEAAVSHAVLAGECQNSSSDINLSITREDLSARFPAVLLGWR